MCFFFPADKVNAEGGVNVTYIDYGNSESIDIKHLRLNPKLDVMNKAPPNAVTRIRV